MTEQADELETEEYDESICWETIIGTLHDDELPSV